MRGKKLFFFILCFVLMSFVFFCALRASEAQNRERIRENINTLRLLRMTQELDLTEEQTIKIFPAINRIEKEKMVIHLQIGLRIGELKSMLREEPLKEEEISNKIKSIKDLRLLLKAKDNELEKFVEDNLTLIQKAKYLVFLADFSRGLGEKLERARMMRVPKGEKREP